MIAIALLLLPIFFTCKPAAHNFPSFDSLPMQDARDEHTLPTLSQAKTHGARTESDTVKTDHNAWLINLTQDKPFKTIYSIEREHSTLSKHFTKTRPQSTVIVLNKNQECEKNTHPKLVNIFYDNNLAEAIKSASIHHKACLIACHHILLWHSKENIEEIVASIAGALSPEGLATIITLQKKEGPDPLEAACKEVALSWRWIPVFARGSALSAFSSYSRSSIEQEEHITKLSRHELEGIAKKAMLRITKIEETASEKTHSSQKAFAAWLQENIKKKNPSLLDKKNLALYAQEATEAYCRKTKQDSAEKITYTSYNWRTVLKKP